MRTIGTSLALSVSLLFAGCTKHEGDCSAPPVQAASSESPGTAKTNNIFVFAQDAGQALANLQLNVHCGPALTTNATGRLMFGGACPVITQLAAGNFCFERNQYYYLKPTGNSNSRMILRFKFDNTFDPGALTMPLVRYEPSTYTWMVPVQVPGFDYAIYDTRKSLPACQGAGRL